MNRARAFVPLGVPASAVKLLGHPRELNVGPWTQVLAFNKSLSETVISPGRYQQVSVLANHEAEQQKQWKLHSSVLLAQQENQFVLSATGGLYRVDVGYGSQFVCDPSKVMGTLGLLKTRVVYPESRLDVVRAWLQVSWAYSVSITKRSYQFMARWLSRIPIPQSLRGVELPKLTSLRIPPQVIHTLRLVRARTGQVSAYVSRKAFHWTHSPKVVIEGPCSILIKP